MKKWFTRKKEEERAVSLSALTWQRFKKERQAIVSLAYIGLVIIVAVLGYLITPDSTPSATTSNSKSPSRNPDSPCNSWNSNPNMTCLTSISSRRCCSVNPLSTRPFL